MGNLFAELKRRHIYRVAAAYAVVAWVLLQLFNNLEPILKLPDSAGTLVLVLLLGGFPVAVLFAWVRELAPADGGSARATTGKLDWVLIGALVVVIALVSYQQVAPSAGTAQRATVADVPRNPGNVISIAVLPFVNLSSDKEQEFFSDGMTEEITAALAQIPGLRVTGRTSAFEFKGQNKDLRTIGQALGVSHLIEGSVRKAGNRVRITAQLVRAADDSHLWAENYDRDLIDVFAIQEDIAKAIAASLRVPLGLAQGDTLVRNRTKDLESYDQYLRAKALERTEGLKPLTDAIALLEQVVARDPGFAPGWALLADSYAFTPALTPEVRRGSLEDARLVARVSQDKGEKAAREAIRLDSRNAIAYGALARIQDLRGNRVAAEDLFKEALARDSSEPEVLENYCFHMRAAGRLKEAVSLCERLRMLEPFVPLYSLDTANIMQLGGQSKASIPILEATRVSVTRNTLLARAYAEEGRYGEAADTLLATPQQDRNEVSRQSVEDAARLLRTAPTKVKAPEALPLLEGNLIFVYAYVGAPDRVFEIFERNLEIQSGAGSNFWLPLYAPLRKTERFKALMRKAGLVDYWRARGWPDLCRPVGAEDFVCD